MIGPWNDLPMLRKQASLVNGTRRFVEAQDAGGREGLVLGRPSAPDRGRKIFTEDLDVSASMFHYSTAGLEIHLPLITALLISPLSPLQLRHVLLQA